MGDLKEDEDDGTGGGEGSAEDSSSLTNLSKENKIYEMDELVAQQVVHALFFLLVTIVGFQRS